MRVTRFSFLWNVLLLVLLLAGSASAGLTESQRAWLAESDRPVRIAYNESFVPLSSRDPKGDAIGILPDFVRWMEDRYGFDIELTSAAEDQMLEGILSGRFDAAFMYAHGQHDDSVAFTAGLIGLTTTVYVPAGSSFKALEDLNGAVVAQERSAGLLTKRGIDVEALDCTTLEGMIKLVEEGRADALIATDIPLIYLLSLNQKAGSLRPLGESLKRGEMRLFVQADNQELLGILSAAAEESNQQGVIRWIAQKWFGPDYQSVGSYLFRYSSYVIIGIIGLLLAVLLFWLWDIRLTRHIYKKTQQLRNSEERLRAIFQNSPDAIFIRDEDGFVLDANPVACNFHGMTRDEIVGKNILDMVPEAQRDEVKRDFPKWFTGELKRYEGLSLDGSGRAVPVEVIGAPLRYEGKTAVLLLVRDMTEREQSERALKESETRYRGLVESQKSLIVRLDTDGRFTFVNEAFCQFLGSNRDELIGEFFHPYVYNDDLEQPKKAMEALITQSEKSVATEYRVRSKTHTAWVHWEVTAIFDEAGRVIEIQTVGQDITDRRRINDALQESEKRLQFLFEEIPHIAVQGYGADHEVIFWNRASELLYGYPREEALGKKIETLVIPKACRDEVVVEIDSAVKTGQPSPAGEMTKCRKDGQMVPVYSSRLATFNQRGEREMYAIDIDLSEIKRASQELVKAKEFAERASRAKSEFLANMSHEIRTPMNGVMGMTYLLLDTELDDEQRELAQTAMDSTRELLTILDELLDISRIEAGEVHLKMAPFCLREIAKKATLLFSDRAHKKGIDLSLIVDPDIPDKMMGDASRIRQVLINLIGNALKFTNEGNVKIHLQAEKIKNGWNLIANVKDTGVGMSPELQKRVFDKFTQGDTSSTREHGGAGLGLAITKQLVELMNGKISVSSAEGQGTTFDFNVILPPLEEDEPLLVELPAPVSTEIDAQVLLVEDNLVNQKVAVAMITKFGGTVTVVNNGAEALEAIPDKKFDLIFMDCQMPVMDGFEATRAIRQMVGELRDIPIVAITAHALKEDRQKCLDAGMDDYLAKPVRRDSLLAVLQKYCG